MTGYPRVTEPKNTWELMSQRVRIESFLSRDCSINSLPCRVLVEGIACHVT